MPISPYNIMFLCFIVAIGIQQKGLQQQIILTMSSIQVCIRMRPTLTNEQQPSQRQRIVLQQRQCQVKVELTQQKQKIFKFNHVMNKDVQQADLYSAINVEKLIERVVEGYHSTIFAYGQTGSGKTYTIQGGQTQQAEGIIPKAIRDMFRMISQHSHNDQNQRGFRLYLSFIQIYNESIYDLIDPSEGRPLKMRWNKHQQFTVQNLFQCQCRNAEEALGWWRKGLRNKIMGTHKMNNASSRSHCMLTLKLHNYSLEDPSDQIESKLQIVDLAGSERYKSTKSQGVVFKEGIEINKSLFTLRQVIASLYQTSAMGKIGIIPPYRDSKLTSLLKQSIGGNSYCLMIACLNPSMNHFEQSLQTLTYASMASYINNVPTVNIDPKVRQNEQLRQHILSLNKEIKKLEDHIKVLTKLVQSNQCISCKRKKDSSQASSDVYEAKEPLGIVSLPKIHDKATLQSNFQQMHAINKQLLSQNSPNQSQTSNKRTINSTRDIIESITMIRDLITSNSFFREKIEFYKEFIQKQQKQMFNLMKENQNLRERTDQLPTIHVSQSTEPTSLAEFTKIINKVQASQKIQNYRSKTHGNQAGIRHSNIELQTKAKISYNDFLKGRVQFPRKNKKRLQSQHKKDSNGFLF